MALSSELEPTLITVSSSSLTHTHTPAAKSLAKLVQEQPQSDRHAVDQLLKEYGMLYKVGMGGGVTSVAVVSYLSLRYRTFLPSVMKWGVSLVWGSLTRGRGGWVWPGPWSTSQHT